VIIIVHASISFKGQKQDFNFEGWTYPFCQNINFVSQCCGSGMFIPDPNISIPDPEYKVQKDS
jgi:hypothetical protein